MGETASRQTAYILVCVPKVMVLGTKFEFEKHTLVTAPLERAVWRDEPFIIMFWVLGSIRGV